MECNIYFNIANIEHFSSNVASSKKHVLYLTGNELKCIPIDQTSFLERLKAWFGYGPLSLHRIANTIADHCSAINKELDNPAIRSDFYSKLVNKCNQHNSKYHHYMHRILPNTLDILTTSNHFICSKAKLDARFPVPILSDSKIVSREDKQKLINFLSKNSQNFFDFLINQIPNQLISKPTENAVVVRSVDYNNYGLPAQKKTMVAIF